MNVHLLGQSSVQYRLQVEPEGVQVYLQVNPQLEMVWYFYDPDKNQLTFCNWTTESDEVREVAVTVEADLLRVCREAYGQAVNATQQHFKQLIQLSTPRKTSVQ